MLLAKRILDSARQSDDHVAKIQPLTALTLAQAKGHPAATRLHFGGAHDTR
jgi:hypothetical protein